MGKGRNINTPFPTSGKFIPLVISLVYYFALTIKQKLKTANNSCITYLYIFNIFLSILSKQYIYLVMAICL